ncbi:uncharacterized protein EDB93DRAFT_1253641 [Suillus bovinus]|uniref:uncharacterized protein n=1 Tax=Suillus bovinus TaxID=48563 RepID=UPI001B865676|nr:uncharacterized protein EDB93DRAFT_1253641 [Suillus bovinus]KAG2137380.1 hypothetical protein EDB93DRAFT_1253641 [Suillus bovinus]
MSQASGTDGAEDQRAHNSSAERRSPEDDNVRPTEEKKTNHEPSAELPSGIFSSKVMDSKSQSLDLNSDVAFENDYALTLPDIPTSNLEAPNIKWLFETSSSESHLNNCRFCCEKIEDCCQLYA